VLRRRDYDRHIGPSNTGGDGHHNAW